MIEKEKGWERKMGRRGKEEERGKEGTRKIATIAISTKFSTLRAHVLTPLDRFWPNLVYAYMSNFCLDRYISIFSAFLFLFCLYVSTFYVALESRKIKKICHIFKFLSGSAQRCTDKVERDCTLATIPFPMISRSLPCINALMAK